MELSQTLLLDFIRAKRNFYLQLRERAVIHHCEETKKFTQQKFSLYNSLYSTIYAFDTTAYPVVAIHNNQEGQLIEILDENTVLMEINGIETICTNAVIEVELKPFPKKQFEE